jgi:hypothetical protein
MTTGAIIAIVVVVLIVVAVLAFAMPRMRARARIQKRERELGNRRERVAGEHREVAGVREREAADAEQRARIAAKEAEAQRAQAELHSERANMHERGLADDELVADHERADFDPVMNTPRQDALTADRNDADGTSGDEYERGRRDEAVADDQPARFKRGDGDDTAAVRDDADRPARY